MEPIVYIYQDHLQDFWNSGQSQCFGAAFEWKGEQVYHCLLYTSHESRCKPEADKIGE